MKKWRTLTEDLLFAIFICDYPSAHNRKSIRCRVAWFRCAYRSERKSIIKSVFGQIESFLLFFSFLLCLPFALRSHMYTIYARPMYLFGWCACVRVCNRARHITCDGTIPHMNMNLISGGMLLFRNVLLSAHALRISEINIMYAFLYVAQQHSFHSPFKKNKINVTRRRKWEEKRTRK